jgi:hypothetical protein
MMRDKMSVENSCLARHCAGLALFHGFRMLQTCMKIDTAVHTA